MVRVNVSSDASLLLMLDRMRELKERYAKPAAGAVVAAFLVTKSCNDTAFDTQQHDFIDPPTLTQQLNRNAIEELFRLRVARLQNTIAEHRTKRDRAFDIYLRMTAAGNARKEIISTIMEQLHMTKAGAASYYGQARHKFGDA